MADAKGTQRLVVSRRRIALANAAVFLFLFVCLVPVTLALGVGFLVESTDFGDVVAGVVFLVIGVLIAIALVRAGRRRTARALSLIPLIELTPNEFHMRDTAGVDHRVKRSRTVWVAWRYVAGGGNRFVSELDFFAKSGQRVGSWSIPPSVGRPVLLWLRAHQVPARRIRGRAALEQVPFAPDHDRR